MWGMRWTGTANYVYYVLTGLGFAAVWLWWRAPAQLRRAERRMGRTQHGPAALRRGACKCKGCDPLVPMTQPLTDDERAAFTGIKDNYTNAQRGEST